MMLSKNNKSIIFVFLFLIIKFVLCATGPAIAQGEGGTKSIFLGLGARSLSLGNAFVALADDPTAVYFNPAGLDYLEKKSANFFYTNLLAGAQYNFLGLVYPTTTIGSFGFGWMRIGVGDIVERDENAVPGSSFDNSQNQFIFSYAKQIKRSISVGLNIKLERIGFSWENTSDSGVGLDLGVIYRPEFDNAFLSDLSFGLNVQNLIQPRIRLKDGTESIPINLKLGLAKPIRFGEERNAFTLLFDFNKSQNASSSYHVGAEYAFNNLAMLRVGMNNGIIAFGAGAAYKNYHVDYSYGKMFDGHVDYAGNHRFSITIEFGKGKTELIRIAREREDREFRLNVDNQLWFTRESEFNTNMEDGREKYYEKDYLGAYVDFSSAVQAANDLYETAVRLRGENAHDPEGSIRVATANSSIQEAQTMLDLANVKNDSARTEQIRKIASEATQNTREEDLRNFILEHREKGNAFFKSKAFTRALSEWQLALERISQNNDNLPGWVADIRRQLENDVRLAEQQLKGNTQEAIKRANALARRGDYVQALQELNQVRSSGISESEKKDVEDKIRALQSQLTFQQNYEDGIRRYINKDWKNAMQAFDQARKIRPGDDKVQKYYKDAEERSKAIKQDIPPDLKLKFYRALNLFRQGKYEEALETLEEVNKEQPYNKTILEAIDLALERLQAKK